MNGRAMGLTAAPRHSAPMDADPAAIAGPPAGRRRPPAVIALVVVALLAAVAGAPVARAATAADPLGDELMRLTNLDRTALGKAALTIDPTLAEFARDYAFSCPTKPSMTIRGRAQDMADRDYFSHDVAGCLKADGSTLGALDAMAALGYGGARAENIAKNSYATGAATYTVGCALDGSGCASSTPSISTVAVAQRGFMNSDGHRRNILGSYDRFGCGSALGADGWYYYACVFSLGGPAVAPAPTPPPPAVVADATPPTFLGFIGRAERPDLVELAAGGPAPGPLDPPRHRRARRQQVVLALRPLSCPA